jgi:hypothetical protein
MLQRAPVGIVREEKKSRAIYSPASHSFWERTDTEGLYVMYSSYGACGLLLHGYYASRMLLLDAAQQPLSVGTGRLRNRRR